MRRLLDYILALMGAAYHLSNERDRDTNDRQADLEIDILLAI